MTECIAEKVNFWTNFILTEKVNKMWVKHKACVCFTFTVGRVH